MIVETMNHEEVYRELEHDREGVTRWWRHQLEALRRRAIKSRKFPISLWFEYTSPRHNRYLFFTRIFEKRMKRILTGLAAIRRTSDGLSVYTTWLKDQKLIAPMILTPHMFKQYAARCKVDKSGLELIMHYFSQNSWGADSHNQKVVGRSVRYNGEEHMSCCVNEGVLLGQKQGKLFIVRTFITYDMCSGLQQKEFEEKRKEILTDKEMYDAAKEFYK